MESSLITTMEEMKKDFHQRMVAFESNLQASTASTGDSSNLAAEFSTYRAFVNQALSLLQRQIEAVALTVDAMEMQRRRKMLLLHGVAEVPEENTSQLVTDVVKQQIGIAGFEVENIQRCHRMGRPTSSKKPRPILVKLQDTSIRDNVWFNKSKLKGSGITLSEFLTRARHDVFMAAREKFGVSKCWTREGKVYVLLCNGARHRVESFEQLSLIPVDAAKLSVATAKPPSVAKTTTIPMTRRAAASKK